jgi:L-seryl-tRNA(Ser) seleniumtransferase
MVTAVREGYENPKEIKERDRMEVISMTLQPGEELIVGRRLREILLAARKQAA